MQKEAGFYIYGIAVVTTASEAQGGFKLHRCTLHIQFVSISGTNRSRLKAPNPSADFVHFTSAKNTGNTTANEAKYGFKLH